MKDEDKSKEELASLIDHSQCQGRCNPADIERLCREAEEYGSVVPCPNTHKCQACIRTPEQLWKSWYARLLVSLQGVSTPSVKALEASEAVENGAEEIDMVMNIGAMKAGDTELVHEDVSGVVEAAGVPVKVILRQPTSPMRKR